MNLTRPFDEMKIVEQRTIRGKRLCAHARPAWSQVVWLDFGHQALQGAAEQLFAERPPQFSPARIRIPAQESPQPRIGERVGEVPKADV